MYTKKDAIAAASAATMMRKTKNEALAKAEAPTIEIAKTSRLAADATATVSPYLAWPPGSSPPHSSGRNGTIRMIENL